MIKVKLTVMAEPVIVDELLALIKKASAEKTIRWADINLSEVKP